MVTMLHTCLQRQARRGRGWVSEWSSERSGGDIFLTSQPGVWRGWRQLMICTFCQILPGSFAQNGAAVAVSLMHKETLASSFHLHTLSAPPFLMSPYSQRHKDIFIFYKAQTLMKHWRHKYISMNFHICLLPPLLWNVIAFLMLWT